MTEQEKMELKLSYKEEQIEELREIVAGDVKEIGCYNAQSHKWDINYSSILTKLIQEAGRWCEHYASDLFIYWSSIVEKLDNGTMETSQYVFAFYDSGVADKNSYEHCQNRNIYRKVWFLDVKTDDETIKMYLHK
jgi:hypothetical protein